MGLRVRRFGPSWKKAESGVWQPTDIAGLQLWIDFSDATTLFTDAGSTPVSSDGDAIYQANDKSGNSNNMTQATAARRPAYKTNIQNGLSVGEFDGTENLTGSLSGFSADQALTAFVVAYENVKRSAAADGAMWTFGTYDGTNDRRVVIMCFEGSSSDAIRLYGGNTTWADTTYQNWLMWTSRYNADGNAFEGWLNGSTEAVTGSGTGSLNIQGGEFDIGARNTSGAYAGFLYGYIGEVIFYYGALTDANVGNVHTFLNNKWSIY